MKNYIPTKKIKGLRFGQLICNAILFHLNSHKHSIVDPEEIENKLFYVENKELNQIINKFLKEFTNKIEEELK